jgi:hypothetical protein
MLNVKDSDYKPGSNYTNVLDYENQIKTSLTT